MSRSQHSFVLNSGLVIATLLAIVPTSLHAETISVSGKNLIAQTSTKASPIPDTTSTPIKAIGSDTTIKSVVSPQSKDGLPIVTNTPKTGSNLTTENSAKTATSGVKPATGNTPTATPKPPTTAVSTSSPNPIEAVVTLVLNLRERQVYVRQGDKVIAKYPVAIGKKGWETPVGEWQVMEKVTNPGWTSFKDGGKTVLKPGKNNPLGERWIGFWTDGKDMIGFHGTPNIKSIGTAASHGCVRMHNRDVKAMFQLVRVGTVVTVVDK